MRLMFVGSIENLLQKVAVRRKSDTRSVRNVSRQVKNSISVVMLAHLHKILCTGIGEEVDPFLGVKDRGCEVLDEVIVHHIWSVGVEVVLPGLISCIWSLVEIPPIPFGVRFCSGVSKQRIEPLQCYTYHSFPSYPSQAQHKHPNE